MKQSANAGLPIGVARRLLQGGASLVGRVVSTPEEAASAATEGASVVLWQVPCPTLHREASGRAPSTDCQPQ